MCEDKPIMTQDVYISLPVDVADRLTKVARTLDTSLAHVAALACRAGVQDVAAFAGVIADGGDPIPF